MKRKLFLMILVVALCLVLFGACNKEDGTQEHIAPVDGATIAYDGDCVTWRAVDNAEMYYVYMNDSTDYITVFENRFNIRLSENVSFSILSVANNEKYTSAESKGAASFTYLPMVESISVEKRTTDRLVGQTINDSDTCFDHFTWTAVAEADYYELRENGSTEAVNYQPAANSGTLKQPIGANFDGQGGEASLSVLVKSNTPNTYSHWSDVKTVTVLRDPYSFGYNREAKLISWASSASATGYEMKIGRDLDTVENWQFVTGNYFVYGENVSNFKMCVKAIGDYDNDVLDSRLVVRSFQQLAPLEGLVSQFGELKWDPLAVATSYQVRISVNRVDEDENEYTQNLVDTIVSGNSYFGDYEIFYNSETFGGQTSLVPATYTAYVRPIISASDKEDIVSFAEWSQVDFRLLKTPTLEFAGNDTFIWNSINGAASYNVWVYRNGVNIVNETRTEDNQLKFTYDFAKTSGTYEIRIAALSGTENASNGVNSSRKSDPFTVLVISAPTEYTLMSSTYDVQTGASQTLDGQSELNFYFNDVYGADYYVVSHYYDDVDGEGKTTTKQEFNTVNFRDTVDNENELGKYNVNVNSIVADETGRTDTVYLYAKSTLASYRETELGSGEFNDVRIFVKLEKRGDNSYVLVEAGENDPKNMIVMDGDDSTPIEITKLATPQNVVLSGTTIGWDRVSRASGYRIKVICTTNGEYSFVETVYNNMFDLTITEPGQYNIFVKALGNGDVLLDSIYGNAVSVIKLPPVTDLSVVDSGNATNLTWSTSSFNFSDMDYYAQGYEVRIGNEVIFRADANELALENFKQYFTSNGTTCTVTAIGDSKEFESGIKLLDSEKSVTIAVFKLTAPINLTMQSSILTWGAGDDNAQAYRVYDGDTFIKEVTDTSLAITEANGFTKELYGEGHEFHFNVVAVRNANDYGKTASAFYVDSDKSTELQVTMLSVPEVSVAQDTGIISWAKINGAASYLVKITEIGKEDSALSYNVNDSTTAKTVEFVPTILAGADATVRISITAIGNNVDYFNSLSFYYETKLEKLAKVQQKEGEDFEIKIEDENRDNKGDIKSFNIYVHDADSLEKTVGRGYIINVGGIEHFTATGKYTVENIVAGDYEIMVCAAGGNYVDEVTDEFENNTMYINSDYGDVKVIHVLASPASADVMVSYGGLGELDKRLVAFAAIPYAEGYTLTYSYRHLLDATGLTDDTKYEVIKTDVIEFTGDAYTVDGYIDGYDRVCFELSDIDEDVDNILITITVLGDDETSISNTQTVVSYDVR